jgi:delta-aminolevulinic acid dehydratase/porphobilinogen synthase
MVRAAAEKGWINEEAVVAESLTSFFRAGCDMVISYFAEAYAGHAARAADSAADGPGGTGDHT